MRDTATFSAHAFHDALPGGRAGGTLEVQGHGLVFRLPDGRPAVTLPLEGLELRLGGAGNRLVFCTHAACPGWQVYTAAPALFAAPALATHPARQALAGARRRHRLLLWGGLLGSLGGVLLLVLGVWWALDALSALAARRVPPAWEDRLGTSVVTQYRLQHAFMPEPEATALLRPLTAPLAAALPSSRYTLRFYVVNDPSLNAFALPGGHVVIHSGLILKARRADELQGVLGHEIAHVTRQHGLRAVIRSTGLYFVAQALLGDASGLMAALANAGPLLVNQKYSRDFEREADAQGLALLLRARVNPQGMVSFFRLVLEEERRQLQRVPDADTRRALETARRFLGTHPETPERIATLERKIRRLAARDWRDDQAAFLALQAQVRAFVAANDTVNERGKGED